MGFFVLFLFLWQGLKSPQESMADLSPMENLRIPSTVSFLWNMIEQYMLWFQLKQKNICNVFVVQQRKWNTICEFTNVLKVCSQIH